MPLLVAGHRARPALGGRALRLGRLGCLPAAKPFALESGGACALFLSLGGEGEEVGVSVFDVGSCAAWM